MLAIHINESTQNYIADEFNEGIVPMLGRYDPDANGDDTYYIVNDYDPNDIVTAETFWGSDLCDRATTVINCPPKNLI